VSARLERMQSGDQGALRELLAEHGAALEALHRGLADLEACATVADLAIAIWKATVVEDTAVDERAFVLAVAASQLGRGPPRTPRRFVSTDLAAFADLAGRVSAGIGDAVDRDVLDGILERDPSVRPRGDAIARAIEGALAVSVGPPADLERLWSEIEPRLD
jgi:hypothetical protein